MRFHDDKQVLGWAQAYISQGIDVDRIWEGRGRTVILDKKGFLFGISEESKGRLLPLRCYPDMTDMVDRYDTSAVGYRRVV